jgi:hypothetical protein
MQVVEGTKAPDVTFGRSGGSTVALSELWRDRPVVLAFLRHFG